MPIQATDLKTRIEARRTQMRARLGELAGDAGPDATAAATAITAALGELDSTLMDGWARIPDTVHMQLIGWLRRNAN
ncbi:MAG: hypothetical protein K8W52_33380 [Deltaproteobacteria bacterium]|nr:hypothetical protein [Deltaproteobacteria bacterium]